MWKVRNKTIFVWFAFFCLLFSTHSTTGCGPSSTEPQDEKGTVTDSGGEPAADTQGESSGGEGSGETANTKEEAPGTQETGPEPEPVGPEPPGPEPLKDAGKELGPEPPADAGQEAQPEEPTPEPVPEVFGPDPTVMITDPKDNDFIKDTVTIKVDAKVTSTNVSIERVELHIDGRKVDESKQSPYEFTYDTKQLKDGAHKFAAVAFTTGRKEARHEITLQAANFGPLITFVKPKASTSVTGKFDIEVQVIDAVGIKAGTVELYVEGVKVAWTSSTAPTFKASFDATSKPYDSFPIQVKAENTQGLKKDELIWVIHDPAPGPIQAGKECDNSDAQKRCVADHSCIKFGGQTAAKCYKNCDVNGPATQCPPDLKAKVKCIPTWQNTTRGTCQAWEAAPGSLYSICSGGQTCNSGLICVGTGPGTTAYCLETCSGATGTCKSAGFYCAPLSSGGGACIEKCQQACKQDSECSQGQKCTGNVCSGNICANYGACKTISGLSHKVCI